MVPLLFATLLSVQIGPMGPDAPAKQPQMAVSGPMVALTFGAGNTVYFSRSNDSGATFGTPVRVAQTSGLHLGRHRGPRVAMVGSTILISAVAQEKPTDGPARNLLAWRSTDGGKTWSAAVRVNDVPGASGEGLHSMVSDGKGTLFAAWLDHRSGHGTDLYGSRSTDGGLTWSKNAKIYASPEGTICECCHPSVALDSSGEILVMWRNWMKGARDMYLTRSKDGVNFGNAEKLGMGSWQLNACPMDGGGLIVSEGRIVSAWRRDGEIFLASPGAQETSLGKGVDVSISAAKGGAYAVWATPDGLLASGPGRKTPAPLAAKGAFPIVVTLSDGRPLAAWESDGKIVVQPLPF